MQLSNRRSKRERAETTRSALLAVARDLFVRHGYAETSTPQIVKEAGLTRGALYHHFPDKQAVFAAVVEAEVAAVVKAVEAAGAVEDPLEALVSGGDAYLAAMAVSGRSALLLIQAPVVLGSEATTALQTLHGERSLREGLKAAISAGALQPLPLDALTRCLGAAYDRSALAIASGSEPAAERGVLRALVQGLAVRDS